MHVYFFVGCLVLKCKMLDSSQGTSFLAKNEQALKEIWSAAAPRFPLVAAPLDGKILESMLLFFVWKLWPVINRAN